MAECRLADPTKAQIREILARNEDEFGEQRRERYPALFVKAMEDVAEDPEQALVEWKRLSRFDIGTYHIAHSRKHVKDSPGRVRNPKHVLVFSIARDGVIDFETMRQSWSGRDKAEDGDDGDLKPAECMRIPMTAGVELMVSRDKPLPSPRQLVEIASDIRKVFGQR